MNGPLISVIIPVYNVEQYLERCVYSIVTQTYTNFELILVDDGSPDNCPRMCDEWEKRDNRIKVIHKENGGLSSARNAGLVIAKGKYINFVDSDDWMERDALSFLYGLIQKFDADFSMAGYTRELELTNEKDNIEYCSSQRDFLKELFKIGTQKNVMYAWGKLYKRDLFNKVRYPEGLTAEDMPVTFQVALMSTKIAISNRVIYHYFKNPNGICGSDFNDSAFDMLDIADLICRYAKKTENDEYISWAWINRARADFGVLSNMVISHNFKQHNKRYRNAIDTLRSNLRRNLPKLLVSPIPVSRKIVMILLGYTWNPMAGVFNKLYSKFKNI